MTDLWSVYILFLEGDKVYVGNVEQKSIDKRLGKHYRAEGAGWTRSYKPLKDVKPIVYYNLPEKDTAMDLEFNLTIRYMKNYGIDNVRGHMYTTQQLQNEDLEIILKHFAHDDSRCFTCFELGHYSHFCQKGAN